jgi:type IV secretory pathway TraG/TraD family ATPase VirD4
LHSLWIDLLIMRLLTAPQDQQTPVWFVLDELASLQRLPQLHTAITENRKSKNPLVLGFQGKAQLEVIYGHLAEVMLSQPATKIFLKTTEPKAAEWVSNAIGKVEIERMKETHFDGSRSGRNFAVDRQIEPLVMDSEISGLENRHAFLKLGNNVARFHFEYMDVPQMTPAFLPRKVQDDELLFDPVTLVPKASPEVKPALDLEAGVPPLPEAKTTAPPVEQQAVAAKNEGDKQGPTLPEAATSGPDPDSPEEGQEEEDIPVAEPQPMRL